MANSTLSHDIKPSYYYSGQRHEMEPYIPANSNRILEIGCGEGRFGGELKTKRNCEVWGLDINKEAGEKAKAILDTVFIGDIENDTIPLPTDYFDCIVFNDVLEHLKYPWAVLEKLRVNLKKDGYIVASIPNIRYFYTLKDLVLRKNWTYADDGILDNTHLRFFTVKSMADLFTKSGYKVAKIEGLKPIVLPWKFRIINWMLRGKFDDTKYLQFACVAQRM